jgi:ribose/xylose/arabinose/galactoside ABC-type transport system permease subunit
MINGEIDLSIGAVYLFAPFIFHEFAEGAGLALMPALLLAMLM